jgi:SLOG cluster2
MSALGLSQAHLEDAMAEIARHLLALGARLVYGGDLREGGFTKLLFELVARHRRDADQGDQRFSVKNFLAWPVHILKPITELKKLATALDNLAELVLLDINGEKISFQARAGIANHQPSVDEWSRGLTAMRQTMRQFSHARIVLGGRVEGYKGTMPGIAEESLLALQAGQPLFLLGGFGGCARDIAETMDVISGWPGSRGNWPSREQFMHFKAEDCNNGLTDEEIQTLAKTPHIDQAIGLILRGLLRLASAR